MRFYEDLPIPTELTPAGVDAAIAVARRRFLHGDISRFAFASRAYGNTDLRTLPFGHLLDHRLRGPTLTAVVSASPADIIESVEKLLWRMLQSRERDDARKMVAEALHVDPASDARALATIAVRDPVLAHQLLRGRLGSAIHHIGVHTPDEHRATELALVSRLLLYFSCFSVQLVATRAWLLEHPPWREEPQKGPYRIAGLLTDLLKLADLITGIGEYVKEERNRHPSRNPVQPLQPLAQRWRTVLEMTDAELRADLPAIYDGIMDAVRSIQTSAKSRLPSALLKDVMLHKEVFGVSAAEAVAFASTRLVQLRDAASRLVEQVHCGEQLSFPANRSSLPGRNDCDVATLIFVFRVMQLDDLSALYHGPARQKSELADDLRTLRQRHEASGNMIGRDLLDTSRSLFFKGPFERPALVVPPTIRSNRALQAGQSLDVLPEFWLQCSLADCPKVTPEPPTPEDLLARKRALDEQEKRNRPPNVWRASGADKSGRRKPRKR